MIEDAIKFYLSNFGPFDSKRSKYKYLGDLICALADKHDRQEEMEKFIKLIYKEGLE
jgi:hypothetical protein